MTSAPPPLTVAVHGATGTQGNPLVRRLTEAGHDVIALSRRTTVDGPHRVADLDDPDSLAAAYAGVDAVVVQLPLEFSPAADAQAEHVLRALEAAGVPRAVFNASGPLLPAPVGVPYLDARSTLAARLGDVVPAASVVGPSGAFMENLLMSGTAARLAHGELAYPLPAEVPMPWLALDDLAAVVVEALVAEEPPARRVVTGPAALTGDAAAVELSTALGRPVSWVTITPAEFEQVLVPEIGAEAAAGIAGFYAAPGGRLPPPDPETVVVGPTTLAEWASRASWPR